MEEEGTRPFLSSIPMLRAWLHLPSGAGAQSDGAAPTQHQPGAPEGRRIGAMVEPSGHPHKQGSSAT